MVMNDSHFPTNQLVFTNDNTMFKNLFLPYRMYRNYNTNITENCVYNSTRVLCACFPFNVVWELFSESSSPEDRHYFVSFLSAISR